MKLETVLIVVALLGLLAVHLRLGAVRALVERHRAEASSRERGLRDVLENAIKVNGSLLSATAHLTNELKEKRLDRSVAQALEKPRPPSSEALASSRPPRLDAEARERLAAQESSSSPPPSSATPPLGKGAGDPPPRSTPPPTKPSRAPAIPPPPPEGEEPSVDEETKVIAMPPGARHGSLEEALTTARTPKVPRIDPLAPTKEGGQS